jgi:hypothetical protein
MLLEEKVVQRWIGRFLEFQMVNSGLQLKIQC